MVGTGKSVRWIGRLVSILFCLMGVALIVIAVISPSSKAESFSHSLEVSPKMRAELAFELLRTAVKRPNDFNLFMLGSILDESEREAAIASIRKLVDRTASTSLALADGIPSGIELIAGSINQNGDKFEIKITASTDLNVGTLRDSFQISIEPFGNTWRIKGLINNTPILTSLVTAKLTDALLSKEIVSDLSQSEQLVITNYNSPNMLLPRTIAEGYHTFGRTASINEFDKPILSRPYGLALFVYRDPLLEELSQDILICSDASWDRLLLSGNPTEPGEDDWIRPGLSHGSGHYGMSNPTGVAFAAFEMVVADAYNNRAVVYTINSLDGELNYVRTLQNNYNTVIDVAAAWQINREATQEKWSEVAVLSQQDNRIDIYKNGAILQKAFHASDFGPIPLNKPTSICYLRHIVDDFYTQVLYVADNGNKRIVGRHIGTYNVRFSTAPGLFPQDAYITSVEADSYGTVYALDNYNGKLYALSSDLTELYGIYGSKGTGAGQLWYPVTVSHAVGWAAGYSNSSPSSPMKLGDVGITESFTNNTGIKKFVQGFDILGTELTYHHGLSSQRGDYVEFKWHQSGPTYGWISFHNGPPTSTQAYHSEFFDYLGPGLQTKRVYFDLPVDSSFANGTHYAVVNLYGRFEDSHARTGQASVTFTRSFPPAYEGGRVAVEDYGIRDLQTGLEADTVYGYKWYLYWAKPVDREWEYPDVHNEWRANDSLSPIFKLNFLYGPTYTNSTLPRTPQDSIYVQFRPVLVPGTYAGQNVGLVRTKFGIIPATDTTDFDQLCPGANPYSSEPCKVGSITATTQTPGEVCWICQKFWRPFKCNLPGLSCPSPLPPPGCPFLYAWTGENYVFVNNILPQAEAYPVEYQTDWQLLPEATTTDSGQIILKVEEEERELSTFELIKLYAVDLPESLANVTITNLHELVDLDDSIILPMSAISNQGQNVLADVIAEDGQDFGAVQEGYIDLVYEVNEPLSSKDGRTNKIATSAPGGINPPRPPKNMTKPNAASDTLDPDIYIISVDTGNGNFVEISRIAPRINETDEMIELSDYIQSGLLKLRVAWNYRASIDYLPYYNFHKPTATVTELPLISAMHSAFGNVATAIANEDSSTTTLSPGHRIDLVYSAGSPVSSGYVRKHVFEAIGTYYRLPWEEEPPGDSTEGGSSGFSFEQAYPNPANPSTSFRFSLPQSGRVVLNLYNILGQQVATLIDEIRAAGEYTVNWNGSVNGGKVAATGVYFAKLTAGSYTATRKVVIVK